MSVVIHLDIDNFYVAVERADDPSLVGRPVAVSQGNSGGFVALSAEAKAAGLRKGDGVGAQVTIATAYRSESESHTDSSSVVQPGTQPHQQPDRHGVDRCRRGAAQVPAAGCATDAGRAIS